MFSQEYYLATDSLLARRATAQSQGVIERLHELRSEGREAVALYWPKENIYTIAAEPGVVIEPKNQTARKESETDDALLRHVALRVSVNPEDKG